MNPEAALPRIVAGCRKGFIVVALVNLTLCPGSPAEVSIVTGEQTLMNSLLRPLTDTVQRGATQN
jgi:hypothetical protein